jgi:hypothetical protein
LKKVLIAAGAIIIAQAFQLAPFYSKPFYWILFVVFLLFGLYTIYDALQSEK